MDGRIFFREALSLKRLGYDVTVFVPKRPPIGTESP